MDIVVEVETELVIFFFSSNALQENCTLNRRSGKIDIRKVVVSPRFTYRNTLAVSAGYGADRVEIHN